MSASEEEDEETAMASFMGFSTFGKAPAAKKRKFNPATDACVEGEELKMLDRGGRKGKGSGGNEVPLGRVRERGGGGVGLEVDGDDLERGMGGGDIGRGGGMNLPPPVVKHNQSQWIDPPIPPQPTRRILRASPPREQEDGAAYMDTSLPPPVEGPAYMDTSLTPPIDGLAYDHLANITTNLPPPSQDLPTEIETAEAAQMQETIDRIMASIQPPPGQENSVLPNLPPPPGISTFVSAPGYTSENQSIGGGDQGRGGGLPSRPPGGFQGGGGGFGSAGRGRGVSDAGSRDGGNGRQRGERNEEWYVGYYDPAFNENPWERLEKERGLVSLGVWVERGKKEVK